MYILNFFTVLSYKYRRYFFAVFSTKLSVRWSLNFATLGFFFKAITLTLGHGPVSYMLLISPVTILRPLLPLRFAKYKYIYRVYFLSVHVRLLVFWSMRSIADICNIILPSFHCLSLICYYIAFWAFSDIALILWFFSSLVPSSSFTLNQNILFLENPLNRHVCSQSIFSWLVSGSFQ
jgi:hypothetical protein